MACWNLQSGDAATLPCGQTNGLPSIAYSFMMTAITPVNTAYAYRQTLSDCRSLCASRRLNGLQRSPSTA
jgi:hypothetical protein